MAYVYNSASLALICFSSSQVWLQRMGLISEEGVNTIKLTHYPLIVC